MARLLNWNCQSRPSPRAAGPRAGTERLRNCREYTLGRPARGRNRVPRPLGGAAARPVPGPPGLAFREPYRESRTRAIMIARSLSAHRVTVSHATYVPVRARRLDALRD